MIAIGILGIGLIAVASLYPVAGLQLKRASVDTGAVVFGNNVLSVLQANGASDQWYPAGPGYQVPTGTLVRHVPVSRPARFGYRLLYRRPSLADAAELVVLVYDIADDAEGPDYSIGLSWTSATIDRNGNLSASEDRASAGNQLVFSHLQSDPDRTFLLRLLRKGKVAVAPDQQQDANVQMYVLYDEVSADSIWQPGESLVSAAAIVTGATR